MALGVTNISSQLIAQTLGITEYDHVTLCTNASINKWSKFKPVVGPWPEATGGLYGLEPSSNWNYAQPTRNLNIAQFREYEHAAVPPYEMTDWPTGEIVESSIAFTMELNASSILWTDLGHSAYYFGIRLYNTTRAASYYKNADCSFGEDFPTIEDPSILKVFIFNVSDGNNDWYTYISSSKAVSGSEPNDVIYFPTFASYDTSGSFSRVVPLIETDKPSITMTAISGEYSDYCAIDVTPNTMNTTITKIDTGDGTTWAGEAQPAASGTGDYSFRYRSSSDNFSTTNSRSFTARISDDAGNATSVDVTVTQQPAIE